MQNPEIQEFGIILLFIIGGIAFVAITFFMSYLVRPKRPNPEKLTTYECGEDAVGNVWGHFNIRFYLVALLFVLFEVEILFLFPWATVFGQKELIDGTQGQWGWFAFVEVFVFVGILALGLAYAWAKGYLDWVKPAPKKSDYVSKIPTSAYDKINQQTYAKRTAPVEQN
ncbi:NADH dehydrogenase [marine bacterium AO1-C]|nr:NADH dehydrogenase [marine bacterium AO1-C]